MVRACRRYFPWYAIRVYIQKQLASTESAPRNSPHLHNILRTIRDKCDTADTRISSDTPSYQQTNRLTRGYARAVEDLLNQDSAQAASNMAPTLDTFVPEPEPEPSPEDILMKDLQERAVECVNIETQLHKACRNSNAAFHKLEDVEERLAGKFSDVSVEDAQMLEDARVEAEDARKIFYDMQVQYFVSSLAFFVFMLQIFQIVICCLEQVPALSCFVFM